MFIYSLRASTLKFFAVVCVALATLITLIAFVPAYGNDGEAPASKNADVDYDGIKTNEDRVKFLSGFGWEVDPSAVESIEVTIPEDFDKVFTGYNEIQKRQKCISASEVKGEEQVLGMTPAHSTTKGVGRPSKPHLQSDLFICPHSHPI